MEKNFARINPKSAGIDLGSQSIYVSAGEDQPVCSFASTTPELQRLIEYLQQQQIASVAMESTGVLWIPLYEMLEEAGIAVCLVNGAHARNVPGRKSDVADCQWLRQLHEYGLLRRSFIPPDEIRVLRTYLRLRIEHIGMAAQHVQHMQRALELMNLKLHLVLNQLQGASGLRVLKAILDGQRDADTLLGLCDVRIRTKKASEFRAALMGHYRDEHLFALKQAIDCWEYYAEKISECDQQIDRLLETITSGLPQPPADVIGPTKPGRHHRFGGDASQLHRMIVTLSGGVNVSSLPGFSDLRALEALSEVGSDMSPWKTEKHFSGWLNIAPSMHRSGKSTRRRRRQGSPRAAQIFRLAAQSVAKSSTALGAFYRRIRARSGPAVAVKATAHKIAVIFYRMMRYGQAYVEIGVEEYERNVKEQQFKILQRRAAHLGFTLLPATSP